jgi:hypothetical protein
MNRLRFDYWQFHWRRFSADNPRIGYWIVALTIAVLAAVVAATLAHLRLREAGDRLSSTVFVGATNPVPPVAAEPALPKFSSSEFVSDLLRASRASGVDIERATFALESQPQLPFLKYSARFETTVSYPAVRAMVSSILGSLPYSAVEEFSCAKVERSERFPRCSIHVSAFYSRGESGR